MTAGLLPDNTPAGGSDTLAINRGGYTYFGGVRWPGGGQLVHRINNATLEIDQSRLLRATFTADDHNTIEHRFTSSRAGYLYADHDGTEVYFRRSVDFSPLRVGSEVTVLTGTGLTYTKSWEYGGRLFASVQKSDAGSSGGWECIISDDGGETWTRKKRLYRGTTGFSTAQFYFNTFLRGDSLVVGLCRPHPANAQNPIRVLTWSLATGEVITSAGSVGTIEDGTNDTPLASFNSMANVRLPGASRSQDHANAHDASQRIILFEGDTGAIATNRVYYLGQLDPAEDPTQAASWTFQAMTLPAGIYGSPRFDVRDPTGNTIFATFLNDTTYTLERLTTVDAGENWTSVETLRSSSELITKLVVPQNAGNAIPVLWGEGTVTSFSDQDLDTRWPSS